MQEVMERVDKVPDPSQYRILGSAAAIVLVASMSELAANAYTSDHAPDIVIEESTIVAGVRSQVEKHSPTENCKFSAKNQLAVRYCHGTPDNPRLLVEQCGFDVFQAKEGRSTQSLDDRIGKIGKRCTSDWVSVSAQMWADTPDGKIVVFAGTPADHLPR